MSTIATETRLDARLRASGQGLPGDGRGILFVCMPWATLDTPNIALSALAPIAARELGADQVDTWYVNHCWAAHLKKVSGGRIDEGVYKEISGGYFIATGDWIFSSALFGIEDPAQTRFHQIAGENGVDMDTACEMYRRAPEFIRELAEEVVRVRPGILGLTTTFLQNTASLSLAQAVKRLDPGIKVVLGGANCDGVQGEALARAFPFVDAIVRGEGETLLPQVLPALAAGDAASLSRIPQLVWRDGTGALRVNCLLPAPVSMGAVPYPSYDGFFASLRDFAGDLDVRAELAYEASRGCWWGEKHHCTFCGLNGAAMAFREKEPERVRSELYSLAVNHEILDFTLTDNILSVNHIRSLLPELEHFEADVTLFAEVKANLKYRELDLMRRAGVVMVQPGIESLSTHVLGLMRKGVTGAQNVALLRNCRTLGIKVTWNYLFGFPGETVEDYEDCMRQFEALHHLDAPTGSGRVALERFSPYFDDKSLGLIGKGPTRAFASIYDGVDPALVHDFVYLHDGVEAGIASATVRRLTAAVERWQTETESVEKFLVQEPGRILGVGIAGPDRDTFLKLAPAEAALLAYLGRPRRRGGLRSALLEAGDEQCASGLEAGLSRLRSEGLVFENEGWIVATPTGRYDGAEAGE